MSLLVSIVLAGAVAGPAPVPPSINTAASATPPWLTVVESDDLPRGVASWYEELLRKRMGLPSTKQPGSPFDQLLSYRREWSEFETYDDPLAGTWVFVDPAGSRWPTQAMRFEFGDPERYAVTARLYCSDTAAACARFRAEASTMRAPMSPQLQVDEPAYAQWVALVRAEPCTRGPELVNPPKYPAAAFREGAHGLVRVRVFVNACGEVRDVRIEQGSGNHHLDQAALDATRWWRLSSLIDVEGFNGWAIVPVNFPEPEPHVEASDDA